MVSKTALAEVVLVVPFSTSFMSPASCAGVSGIVARCAWPSLTLRRTSVITQLEAALGLPLASATFSK